MSPLAKFGSRKFLLSAATVAGLVAAKAYAEAAAAAIAYVTTEGLIDHATTKKASSVLGTLEEVVDAVSKELAKVPGVDGESPEFGTGDTAWLAPYLPR